MKPNEANQKQIILVLFGGESAEHEVSIASARNVYAALDLHHVVPILCYIDTKGKWWYVNAIERPRNSATRIVPLPGVSSVLIGDEQMHIDVIFPVLHGTNGEDGTVQGTAKLMHTPIVGCGIEGSVLCMNKVLAKQLLAVAGIPVVPCKTFSYDQPITDFAELAEQLGSVLFIKPVRQGSSVGVSKATNQHELSAALREAFKYDTEVLIEKAIDHARELEVAVLGSTHEARASAVGEIMPDQDFYSYESKYGSDSASKISIPAVIPQHTKDAIQDFAVQAFALLRCQGLSRVDFFMDAHGELYLNELNTMPGFTNISMYPKLWEATGFTNKQLVARLIELAK